MLEASTAEQEMSHHEKTGKTRAPRTPQSHLTYTSPTTVGLHFTCPPQGSIAPLPLTLLLKAHRIFLNFPPQAALILAFITLNVMWLKFLCLWRFARLWALLDGVECVENMQRCMNNNYSIVGFWKGWHASFNRWLVRYTASCWIGGREGPRI